MNIKDLQDKEVRHIKLGVGKIVKTEDNLITIEFKTGKVSQFQYPGAFRSFLTATDEALSTEIEKDINKWLIASGTLETEKLKAKTAATQLGIVEREEERKRLRIERAKADAQKSRFYLNMSNPDNEEI